MKVKRLSIFETNSSSMHSITYQNVKDKSLTKLTNIKDGVLTIYLDEYSDGLILKTPDQKLSYVCTWLLQNRFWFEFEDIDKLNSCLENLNDIEGVSEVLDYTCSSYLDDFVDLLEKVRDNSGATRIEFKLKSDYPGIDWQSQEVLDEFLNYSGVKLETLIFDPNYIIVVDWDSGEYEDEDGNYDFHGELELEE